MDGQRDTGAPRGTPGARLDDLWYALLLDGDTPTPVRQDPSRPKIVIDEDAHAARPPRPSMASIPDRQSCSGSLPLPVPPPRASGVARAAPMSAPVTQGAPVVPGLRSPVVVPPEVAGRGVDESHPAFARARSRTALWLAFVALSGVAAGIGITASGSVDPDGAGTASPALGAPASIAPPDSAGAPSAPPSSTVITPEEEASRARGLAPLGTATPLLPAPTSSATPLDVARPQATSRDTRDTAPEKAPAGSKTEKAPETTGAGSILDKEL